MATTSPSERPALALVPDGASAAEAPRIDEATADRLYAEALAAARRAGRIAAELEGAAAGASQPGWRAAAASCRRAEANLRACAQTVPEVPPAGGGIERRRPLAVGPLTIDRLRRAAFWADAPLALTRLEFDLLCALAERAGEVVTKADLLRSVWGYAGRTSRTRTVDSHASRVRRALHDAGASGATVVNVWGIGYRFCVAEPDDAA